MDIAYFIAKRISHKQHGSKSLSYLIIKITTIAVALSLATMILSVSIVLGFRSSIIKKISGFVGHIIITKQVSEQSYQLEPIPLDSTVIKEIKTTPGVRHVQVFAIKPGLIKHKNVIQGIVLKGIWKDFDWKTFSQYIVAGKPFKLNDSTVSNKMIISQELAQMLRYKVGKHGLMFFIQNPPRFRKLKIQGLYKTGLVDFDKIYVLVDIRQIQRLNDWTDSSGFMISGYEVFVKNFKDLDKVEQELKQRVAFGFHPGKPKLAVQSVKDLYPDIFDWLTLVDMNVVVILIVMIVVALINMTTGMLIIILEKSRFIGIMKSLGARNKLIRKIFLYNSWFILRKGLIWGNVLGLGLALIQKIFHVIPLNSATYYVSYVPISLRLDYVVILNIGVVIITLIFMILPTTVATKLDPVRVIKFE